MLTLMASELEISISSSNQQNKTVILSERTINYCQKYVSAN